MTDAAENASDPLLQRQLRMLGELAEIGLEVARAIEQEARGVQGAPDGRNRAYVADISLAYTRVSRAVRLTILAQSRLIADHKAAADRARAEAEAREAEALEAPVEERKARVERIVERLAAAEHPGDEDEVDELVGEAAERLDDEDLYGDLMERPVSEIVARICADLGLSPDWTALAQEPWAQAEIAGGMTGWPLSNLPRGAVGGGPPAAERAVEGARDWQDRSTSLNRDSS